MGTSKAQQRVDEAVRVERNAWYAYQGASRVASVANRHPESTEGLRRSVEAELQRARRSWYRRDVELAEAMKAAGYVSTEGVQG